MERKLHCNYIIYLQSNSKRLPSKSAVHKYHTLASYQERLYVRSIVIFSYPGLNCQPRTEQRSCTRVSPTCWTHNDPSLLCLNSKISTPCSSLQQSLYQRLTATELWPRLGCRRPAVPATGLGRRPQVGTAAWFSDIPQVLQLGAPPFSQKHELPRADVGKQRRTRHR